MPLTRQEEQTLADSIAADIIATTASFDDKIAAATKAFLDKMKEHALTENDRAYINLELANNREQLLRDQAEFLDIKAQISRDAGYIDEANQLTAESDKFWDAANQRALDGNDARWLANLSEIAKAGAKYAGVLGDLVDYSQVVDAVIQNDFHSARKITDTHFKWKTINA